MKLPKDILNKINRLVSKHKNPEKLDWLKRNDKWEAIEDGHTYVLLYDDNFGYVVAETKQISYQVG